MLITRNRLFFSWQNEQILIIVLANDLIILFILMIVNWSYLLDRKELQNFKADLS